jgi:8-oxo-dGTP pyrophosphatase MutT (NUDIX family)
VSEFLTVRAVIVTPRDEVVLVRRSPNDTRPNTLELPGGGVEEGELEELAIIRELKEEIGLSLASTALQKFHKDECQSKSRPGVTNKGIYYRGYIGRQQQAGLRPGVEQAGLELIPLPSAAEALHLFIHQEAINKVYKRQDYLQSA